MFGEYDENEPLGIEVNRDSISVRGLRFCLPFLRCFGEKISSITVFYSDLTDSQNDHVDQYINEYCCDTLKDIRIDDKERFSDENFPKPFKSVTQ